MSRAFSIDPARTWSVLEDRLAATADPRHRHMLGVVIAHLRAEVAMDLDAIMATMVGEPRHRLWIGGTDVGAKGHRALADFYAEFVGSGRGVFEFEVDRITVDEATVVTEGTFHICYGGELARETGFVAEGDGPYLCPVRTVVVWPFDDDGGLLGEDIYATFDPAAAVALPDAMVPQRWRELVGGQSGG